MYDESYNPDVEDEWITQWKYDCRIRMADSVAEANKNILTALKDESLPESDRSFLNAYVDVLRKDPGFDKDYLSEDIRFHYKAALVATHATLDEFSSPLACMLSGKEHPLVKYVPLDGFRAAMQDGELDAEPFFWDSSLKDAPEKAIYSRAKQDVREENYLRHFPKTMEQVSSAQEREFLSDLQKGILPIADQIERSEYDPYKIFEAAGEVLRAFNAAIDNAILRDNITADIVDMASKYALPVFDYEDFNREYVQKAVDRRIEYPTPEVAAHLGIDAEATENYSR